MTEVGDSIHVSVHSGNRGIKRKGKFCKLFTEAHVGFSGRGFEEIVH
jgi:hypothetical protein